MSDRELREVERGLLAAPASLELRRQHAHLLTRAGLEERALAAVDLAWRLGAEELWDDLQARLQARRLELGPLALCYVPGGPFAMGADDRDADAAPLHLVELPGFYVAERPLTLEALEGWEDYPRWLRGRARDYASIVERSWQFHTHDQALDAVAHLAGHLPPPGLTGRYALIAEAQWERVFRAAYLRPDGRSPYGAVPCPERKVEWTADRYRADAYDRREPGPEEDEAAELWAVRGVPALPPPDFAIYREAATRGGRFVVERGRLRKSVREVGYEPQLAARPVFLPAAG